MNALAEAVRDWDPPPETAVVALDRWPPDAFAALLDQPPPAGDHLPPLWQWLYFLEHPRSDELGPDGHPASGHFLPPIPRRLRMFAGGRLEVRSPLRLGSTVRRDCRITDAVPKTGRSGEMLFVTERREYSDDGGVVVVEEQDVVYRQAPSSVQERGPKPSATPGAPSMMVPDGRIGLVPDSRMLFRYSALTYNAHRIHHDEPYARGVEGYPGLVVHGPLLALLLLEPARRRGRSADLATYTFRLRRPAFAGTPIVVTVDGDELSAGPLDGEPSVTGSVTWRMGVSGR